MKANRKPAYYYLHLLSVIVAGILASVLLNPFVFLFIPVVDGHDVINETWIWFGIHLYMIMVLAAALILSQLWNLDYAVKKWRLQLAGKWWVAAMGLGLLFLGINILPHMGTQFYWFNSFAKLTFGFSNGGPEFNIFFLFFLPLPFLWNHILSWQEPPASEAVSQSI